MFSVFCATSRLLCKCQDHYSASCTLGLCLTLPKASLESTHARLLGPPLWRNQGQHNPSQPKIVGTTVSAFALPPPPLPDVCMPPQGLATAPCAQEHCGDGAGGSPLGTSGRAIHKSRRRSTPTAVCHCLAKGVQGLLGASAHSWKESQGDDISLLLFYKIYRTTRSSWGSWCLEKTSLKCRCNFCLTSACLHLCSLGCSTEDMVSAVQLQILSSW